MSQDGSHNGVKSTSLSSWSYLNSPSINASKCVVVDGNKHLEVLMLNSQIHLITIRQGGMPVHCQHSERMCKKNIFDWFVCMRSSVNIWYDHFAVHHVNIGHNWRLLACFKSLFLPHYVIDGLIQQTWLHYKKIVNPWRSNFITDQRKPVIKRLMWWFFRTSWIERHTLTCVTVL
jgi:hypothetical protein